MKSHKKSFSAFLLFSLLANIIFAQATSQIIPKGTALCDEMFTFLQKNEAHPQVQPLTAGGTNNLPYNIIVNFSQQAIKSEYNLVILFDMENARENKELLLPIIDKLKEQNYNSCVVLCYESKLNIPRQNIIYGSDVFASSLNTNINNSVLIFNLSAKKNAIVSGSNGYHSPSWMLKNMFDSFSEAKITDGLPLFFISQVADFTFSTDRQLLSFFEAEIPCISADIKDKERALEVINSCITLYDSSRYEQSDSHAFMFRFFGKRFWFSEYRIVSALIVLILIGFILVFCVGFVNRTVRKEFWQEIRSNWYVIPLIYILCAAGFFTGKLFYSLFVPATSTNYTVFGCILPGLSLSTLLVSVFYMLNLSLLKKYTTRSLDFILVIDTFINQVVFTLLDVSLFPIFLTIFIVAVISLIFRRNWIHIILFVFLIIPFVPYVNALFSISDSEKLHTFLIKSNALPFVISLVLLPVYLMWLRILNAIKKRYAKKRVYALVISAAYFFIFLIIIILNRTFYSNKKAPAKEIAVLTLPLDSAPFDFDLTYEDKTVFSDIIRCVKISSSTQPVYNSIKIISLTDTQQPVLYSENDFSLTQTNEANFSVPLYPPQKMEFNYGTTQTAQIITAEQIFYSQEANCYFSVTRTLKTGGGIDE